MGRGKPLQSISCLIFFFPCAPAALCKLNDETNAENVQTAKVVLAVTSNQHTATAAKKEHVSTLPVLDQAVVQSKLTFQRDQSLQTSKRPCIHIRQTDQTEFH
jgi:ribosomal protein L10